MTTAGHIIVCEKSGQWATALRRVLARDDCRLVETRSLAECWQELARGPAAVVVLEVTPANWQAVVARLSALTRRASRTTVVVVGTRDMRPCEPAVREAGAVWLAFSPQQLTAGGPLIQRRLQQATPVATGVKAAIWNRLPWGV